LVRQEKPGVQALGFFCGQRVIGRVLAFESGVSASVAGGLAWRCSPDWQRIRVYLVFRICTRLH